MNAAATPHGCSLQSATETRSRRRRPTPHRRRTRAAPASPGGPRCRHRCRPPTRGLAASPPASRYRTPRSRAAPTFPAPAGADEDLGAGGPGDVGRAVGTAVGHDHDPDRRCPSERGVRRGAGDRGQAAGQHVLLVPRGDDDGDHRRRTGRRHTSPSAAATDAARVVAGSHPAVEQEVRLLVDGHPGPVQAPPAAPRGPRPRTAGSPRPGAASGRPAACPRADGVRQPGDQAGEVGGVQVVEDLGEHQQVARGQRGGRHRPLLDPHARHPGGAGPGGWRPRRR